MITLYLLNAILIGHFMGDYIFQKTIVVPDKQSLLSLLLHSLIYTFVFGVIFFAATYKMYDSSLIFQYSSSEVHQISISTIDPNLYQKQ